MKQKQTLHLPHHYYYYQLQGAYRCQTFYKLLHPILRKILFTGTIPLNLHKHAKVVTIIIPILSKRFREQLTCHGHTDSKEENQASHRSSYLIPKFMPITITLYCYPSSYKVSQHFFHFTFHGEKVIVCSTACGEESKKNKNKEINSLNSEEHCDHLEIEESSPLRSTMTLILTAVLNLAKEVWRIQFSS